MFGCGVCVVWVSLSLLQLARGAVSPLPAAAYHDHLHCTDHYTLHGTFCYRYFGLHVKRTYYYAQKLCLRHHSSLVSIYSPGEETFVVQLAENNTSFWIGLDDLEGPHTYHKEGIFKWSSHSVLTGSSYINWRPGEPNNRQYLDCVKADCTGWSMAGGGCASTKLPFICKKQACPLGLEASETECDTLVDASPPSTYTRHHNIVCVILLAILLAAVICFNMFYCRHIILTQEHFSNPIRKEHSQTYPRKHSPSDQLYPT